MRPPQEIQAELTAARKRMHDEPRMPRGEYSAVYERVQRLSREAGLAYWAEHPLTAAEFTAEDYGDWPDSFEQSAINRRRDAGQMRFAFHCPALNNTALPVAPTGKAA